MTNAQKWVAAFLGLFLLLFVLSKVTEKEEIIDENLNFYDAGEGDKEMVASELDGLTLVKQHGCMTCHGKDLKGTKLGPGLYSAKEYWSRDKLINYLRNPSSYSGDDRFEAYKAEYRTIMPPFGNVDVKDLGVISDYLLSLEENEDEKE